MKKNIFMPPLYMLMCGTLAFGMGVSEKRDGDYVDLSAFDFYSDSDPDEGASFYKEEYERALALISNAIGRRSQRDGCIPGTEPVGNSSAAAASPRNEERKELLYTQIRNLISEEEFGCPPTEEQGLWSYMQRMHCFMQRSAMLRKLDEEILSSFDGGDDPNQSNADGMLPLEYAITEKDSKLVSALLQKGAKPNPAVPVSPLHRAVYVRLPKIVELLLHYGADYHKTDQNGLTPVELVRSLRGNSFVSDEKKHALLQIQEIFNRALAKEKAAGKKRHSIRLPILRRNGNKK